MTTDQDVIRLATPDDARAIAEVHIRTWDVAYRGLVPDAVIDAITLEEREAKWRAIAATAAPLFVSERHGTIIGFLSMVVPSRDDDATDDTAEIGGLYVDPSLWRSGIANALVTRALSWLVDDGAWSDVTLWVLEANERAHGFYSAAGFGPDGARGTWKGLPDVRLRRAVTLHD